MNIFKMSNEEFNEYLDNKIKKITSEEMLDELVKCGLRTITDYKFKELGYIIDDSESDNKILSYHNEEFNIYLDFYLKSETIKISKWDAINEEYIPTPLPLEIILLIYEKGKELGWMIDSKNNV